MVFIEPWVKARKSVVAYYLLDVVTALITVLLLLVILVTVGVYLLYIKMRNTFENLQKGELTRACFVLDEGYVVQQNIYAWESLGIGKYLTALAVLGPVYILLLFLIEANAFCILKSRLSGFAGKEKLVSKQR